ncbi:MAG: hypothetical protein HRT86_15585 [Ilumatobacteraceae bacterium]|nr:hypothetical protein [Ilumatobacteraceae bacterium]
MSITPTRATIIGDTASVAFEASIGGGSTPGLLGEVELVDGVWVALRQQLCTYVGFIGVECPPE